MSLAGVDIDAVIAGGGSLEIGRRAGREYTLLRARHRDIFYVPGERPHAWLWALFAGRGETADFRGAFTTRRLALLAFATHPQTTSEPAS